MTAPKITCAICNRPVDKVMWWTDYGTDEIHIKVKCHGDTDEMTLNPMLLSLDQLKQFERAEGIAFSTKRLEQP